MTVVVAGFDTDPPSSSLRWARDFPEFSDETRTPTTKEIEIDEAALFVKALTVPQEAFLLADSLLSREVIGRDRMPVADSAEKIFAIDIKIAVPDFDRSGFPTGRCVPQGTYSCGLGYAGSAQMCPLVLERFRQEMINLRYTWISAMRSSPGKYAICQKGAPEDIATIRDDRMAYGESIDFASHDLPPLEARFVAEVFAGCFNEALMDHFPKQAQISKSHEVEIDIEFVLLAYCQMLKTPKIYHFDWEDDLDNFPRGFKAVRREVAPGELVVLGHTSWGNDLASAREDAISSRERIEPRVRSKLNAAIEANTAANYVGGKIRSGRLDSLGFQKQT